MEEHEFDSYIKAGEVAKEIKSFARELIKPGMKLIDMAEAIDDKIVELGADFAFPVNLSIDEVAAHYTPHLGDETIAEGLLKIDIGVAVDGYIADTAFSIDLTEDGKHKEMIELNEKILGNVEEIVKPGFEVCEVGDTAQDTLEEWNKENDTNFAIIKSLSGHQLGQHVIHAGLTISNYRNDKKTKLNDVAFAIEPFVTTGAGDIYEGNVGGIYVLKGKGNVRDSDSRKVLKYIKERFKTKPFCLRWLEKEGFEKLKFVISNLEKQGILYQYPMLIEKSKAPVSQAENTFVINGRKVVVSTKG